MSQREIKEAIEILKKGGLIIYQTDTLPAIGCDATNSEAVTRLLELVEREEGCGLVVLAADLDMVARYVESIPQIAMEVVEMSSSPLTIVYPKGRSLAKGVLGQDGSVAIRVPDYPFATTLLHRFNRPIVATMPIVGESSDLIRICFEEIEESLIEGVDWVTSIEDPTESSCSASSIISIKESGVIKIIRK